MAFEQRSKGNTGASTCPSRGTLFRALEFVFCEGSEVDICLDCLINNKEFSVAEIEQVR